MKRFMPIALAVASANAAAQSLPIEHVLEQAGSRNRLAGDRVDGR
jgi:hypothetical protein